MIVVKDALKPMMAIIIPSVKMYLNIKIVFVLCEANLHYNFKI
jgi:hypothetical protein